MIGLIIPDISNPYFPDLVKGVEDICNQYGYHVILCNTDNNIQKEEDYVHVLKGTYVDGIIFAGSIELKEEFFLSLAKGKIPFVLIDRTISAEGKFSSIFSNGLQGAYMAVVHLLERGYKKIGMITGPINSYTTEERLNGYKKALNEYNIEFDETIIKEGDYKFQSGFEKMNEILEETSIDAIFASNDIMALGAMKSLHKKGYSIPKDIAIVGYDNSPLSEAIVPELTTIHQSGYKIGSTAAKSLIELLDGKEDVEKKFFFQPKLIIRETT